MIHITGDTHGNRDWGKVFMAYQNGKIKPNDYLIITGDFGGVWHGSNADNLILNRYERLPFTVLFIDGNHENFDALYQYPVEDWCGGKVHKIRENVLHLMRGHVFTIEGETFFTMGGGTSIDKEWRLQWEHEQNQYLRKGRRPKKIWWEQEIPSDEELCLGYSTLKEHNNKVAYILTHTHSNLFMKNQLDFIKEDTKLTEFLDYVMKEVEYKQWFCGHFHVDRDFPEMKTRMLYGDIVNVL